MQMSSTKERLKETLDIVAVLWIILSTGSLFFCIFNMKMSMFILLGISLLYIVLTPKIGRKQFIIMGEIIILITINSLINIQIFSPTDDIIILLIRLFSLAVICTNVSKERLMTLFCKTVFLLCIISLICFTASELGIKLPGETTLWFKNKYYIYTFYHTIGRWTTFHRNSGLFWEAPAFAIFINIAISFLMLGSTKIESKRKAFYLIIYSITLFSTLAITAYIAFFIILLAILFQKRSINQALENEQKNTRQLISIIILTVLIIFLVRENNTHMITYKILNKVGSYNERANDSLQALKLALNRPFFGYGLFNNYTNDALVSVGVTDNSNSFTSMLMYLGFPLFLCYLILFVRGLRQYFQCSIMSFVLILGSFVTFLNSEQIAIMTLFLMFLFPVNGESEKK